MYVVCGKHLEQAIDEFVSIYEMPPDLYYLEKVQFTDWDAPARCNFCHLSPKYLIV